MGTPIKNLQTAFFTTAALLLFCCADDSTPASVSANPEFRLWCGESACAWNVENGEVAPSPTWHRKVYGISLVTDGTAISQQMEMENVHCLLLSLLGKVDGDAVLHWEIAYDDGDPTVFSESITDLSWKTVYREVPVPDGATRARIILRKTGHGAAIIARAEFEGDSYCAANPSPGSIYSGDTGYPLPSASSDEDSGKQAGFIAHNSAAIVPNRFIVLPFSLG
jgi:hypothetical protein